MQFFFLLISLLVDPELQVSLLDCWFHLTLMLTSALISVSDLFLGLLIAKKNVFKNPVPGGCGGGTVLFVSGYCMVILISVLGSTAQRISGFIPQPPPHPTSPHPGFQPLATNETFVSN